MAHKAKRKRLPKMKLPKNRKKSKNTLLRRNAFGGKGKKKGGKR